MSSDGYGWKTAEAPHSCGYLAGPVLELVSALGARRVLDLGSGNGSLCGALAARGFDVVGVEYDAEGCRVARQAHPSIPFYNLGVQDDPSELLRGREPGFDVVVSTEVIEHLYSPRLLPMFARRVLAPGGHLVLSTPYHGYWKNLALSVLGQWDGHFSALWEGGHIKFFSRRTLTQLLADTGFDVVDFAGVGRLPYLWKSMLLVARVRP